MVDSLSGNKMLFCPIFRKSQVTWFVDLPEKLELLYKPDPCGVYLGDLSSPTY